MQPRFWSVFHRPHKIVERIEGPNDGLVSVASSQWGEYKGTLVGVNHLDLINWTSRIRWLVWELTGNKRTYAAHGRNLHGTTISNCFIVSVQPLSTSISLVRPSTV